MTTNLKSRVRDMYQRKLVTAKEAISQIRSGDRVYVGSNCGQPVTLCEALVERKNDLNGVEIVHLLTFGPAPYVDLQYAENFRHLAFFIGANVRKAVQEGHADYAPIFLSEIPHLFTSGQVPIDVALVAVSPPDAHGFCSMGISVDIGLAACKSAKLLICEVNDQMPRTLGEGFLHVSEVDAFVETSYPLVEHAVEELDEVSLQIGRNIAQLVDDGATIQTGIGKIPSAVLASLGDKNDLGVHTEMFSDALINSIEAGIVNCRMKTLHPNKVMATFCIGTKYCYDYLDDNPFFEFRPTEYVNDPFVVAQNERMVAINGTIEVDLTGQAVSDSIGNRFYSGIGGQVDFVRGAARSKGGKPILALPSTAKGGTVSKIVSKLKPAAGVVTSRGDVHYIVTEYGIAYLHGKSVRERALSLIRIAHPNFRDQLLEEAKELGYIPHDQPSVEAQYPHHLVREVELKTGETVLLRPIMPTDGQRLKKHFYSLSPEAVHRRFNRMVRSLSNLTITELVTVDYYRHMAMVAVQKDGEAETILATARYYLNDTTNTAEIAFAVLDEWQDKGIGRELFNSLAARAIETKVGGFDAFVQSDNLLMLHILLSTGYETEYTVQEGQHQIKIRFKPGKSKRKDSDQPTPLPE